MSYGHATALAKAGLPEPGTRVSYTYRGQPRNGTVQRYDPQWSQGGFPVRFDDGQWKRATWLNVERSR